MKNLIILLVMMILAFSVNAQLVVSDPMATGQMAAINNQMAISNGIQTAIKGYSDLQTNLQKGTLSTVTQSAGFLSKHLDLISAALDVAQAFNNTQMVKDFVTRQRYILQSVNSVSKDFMSLTSNVFSSTVRNQIKTNLDDAVVLSSKSWSVLSNCFVSKQINLSERLNFLREANTYLSSAESKIQSAQYLINTKRTAINRLDETNKLYKMIF